MAKRRPRSRSRSEDSAPQPGPVGKRELVLVARSEAMLRATPAGLESLAGANAKSLAETVRAVGGTLRRLFGSTEDSLLTERMSLEASVGSPLPDLSLFYHVEAADDRLDDLAEQLSAHEAVDAAYVKPRGEPPVAPSEADAPPEEASGEAPAATPDYSGRQIYLNPAPAGVDARFAWTLPGGGGQGVNVIDLEWGWNFDHEDLRQNQGGVIAGTGASAVAHGTAVIGEISGDRNSIGIVGICPDARMSAAAFSLPTATAIRTAANRLQSGDIILLEIHRPGPRHNFQSRSDQAGYIAIEWWPDDFAAIRYAVGRGVIVVEAAGNGAEDLDGSIYDARPVGFPMSWTNPFDRNNRDSGAIVVGAGAPPPGTHGRNHGADRSRLGFSNYGALIDAQGWGREVTTTGGRGSSAARDLRDLQGGTDDNKWYTDRFSGTSSASPIVVGVLGCLQGILRSRGAAVLTPARARRLLRDTGSPQQNQPGRPVSQRIGNRPDLRQLIARVAPGSSRPSLRLIALRCHRTEDWLGPDETYLRINGTTVWGPVSMNNGQSASLLHLPANRFHRRVRLDLYDQDLGGFDRDDHLGTAYAWATHAGSGEQEVHFTADGAYYTLTFEVTA
jgi:hypothetical protein